METNDIKNDLPEESGDIQESTDKKKDDNQIGKGVKKEEDNSKVKADDSTSIKPFETENLVAVTSGKVSSEEKKPDVKESDIPERPTLVEENAKENNLSPESEESGKIDQPEKDKIDKPTDPATNTKEVEEQKKTDSKELPVTTEIVEKNESTSEDIKGGEIKSVDYSTFSLEDLINTLSILVSDRPVQEIKRDLDQIKSNFYKKLNVELDKKRSEFVKEGGKAEDFDPGMDSREEKVKEIFNQYRRKKLQYIQQLELSKQSNLEEKHRIIEGIKGLINKEESINKTFHEFRDLQIRWRSAGLVPQAKLKDLWENYHYHVEKFYDYIKINKELRDLDLRKNLESKISLCEKAESLMLESNIVVAFRTLQKYHEQWREIGPVPQESKDEIWERFRLATSKINKKHQRHFEDLKAGLKKNLEAKTQLCEKVEGILSLELKTHKEWENYSREIINLQKTWKTIGFAPKKYNTVIYERFRKACDNFFNQKREFYTQNKDLQQNNLQLKMDLCVQAEALKDSEEWKKTTMDLITLQKKWKEIGPVPRKVSDKIWRRFRAACDTFFNKKSEFYANIDKKYDENYLLKTKLIEDIENYHFVENMDDNFEKLKDFQKQWSEIGFVPIKRKEVVLQKYRKVIDGFFDRLNIDDTRRNLLKFKNKLNEIGLNPSAKGKLYSEREKFISKVKKLEGDIVLWENNIGFFAKSENANSMIEEISKKIELAKNNLKLFQEKIKLIDKL